MESESHTNAQRKQDLEDGRPLRMYLMGGPWEIQTMQDLTTGSLVTGPGDWESPGRETWEVTSCFGQFATRGRRANLLWLA